MDVKYEQIQCVKYGSLSWGETFIYNNMLYMITDRLATTTTGEVYDAICLEDGCIESLDPEEKVIKVECVLTVKGAENKQHE